MKRSSFRELKTRLGSATAANNSRAVGEMEGAAAAYKELADSYRETLAELKAEHAATKEELKAERAAHAVTKAELGHTKA